MTQTTLTKPDVSHLRAGDAIPEIDFLILAFWILHIPLGLILYLGPPLLATLHGLATLMVAILWSIGPKSDRSAFFAGAYIVGSEVLWRLNDASLFWEFGKYALVLVLLLLILRRPQARFPVLPTLFFLFLLPATIPTILNLDLAEAREQISFNLSGPLSITISAWAFAQISLSGDQIKSMLAALIAPIISIATILALAIFSASEIAWANDSNITASGGFGPNQVSTVMGLGLAGCILMFSVSRINVSQRIALVSLSIWFTVHGLLTFSRGGVLVGIIVVAAIVFLQMGMRRKDNIVRTLPVVLVIMITLYFLFPALNELTGGVLGIRYTETTLTNRDTIGEADMHAFLENPITGVGVGLAKGYRVAKSGLYAGAHTEFTRALAEHGLMGAISYMLLAIAMWSNLRRQSGLGRLMTLTLALWAYLTMYHSAMRLAAPGFAIGLAFATFCDDDNF